MTALAMATHEPLDARMALFLARHLRANYAAFLAQLPALLVTHRGQWALMRHTEILGFFATARDAALAGELLCRGRRFSVHEVTDTPADLGVFSRVTPSQPPDGS